MKMSIINKLFAAALVSMLFVQCSDDDDTAPTTELDFSGTYAQKDIMGRPGVNTVFSGTSETKNNFNNSLVNNRASFTPVFEATLEGLHDAYGASLGVELDYETNILGFDATTFSTVLAQFDALQVAPDAPTTYYDGTNVLTGRRLTDDVIDISLTLMFGGTTGTRFDGMNGTPQLTSDGVGVGDRVFGTGFPYLGNAL